MCKKHEIDLRQLTTALSISIAQIKPAQTRPVDVNLTWTALPESRIKRRSVENCACQVSLPQLRTAIRVAPSVRDLIVSPVFLCKGKLSVTPRILLTRLSFRRCRGTCFARAALEDADEPSVLLIAPPRVASRKRAAALPMDQSPVPVALRVGVADGVAALRIRISAPLRSNETSSIS